MPFGRFWFEFLREDQPKLPPEILGGVFTISQALCVVGIVAGIVIILDRTGHFRIPWIARPQSQRQRQQAFQAILGDRRRAERSAEKEKQRLERRKQREAARLERQKESAEETDTSAEGQNA
jgi:hypothetical protein